MSAERSSTAAIFDWTADPKKWPEFNSPDPAYHGAVFSEALKPFGNITYIVYVRTHLLRDTRRRAESVRRVSHPAGD